MIIFNHGAHISEEFFNKAHFRIHINNTTISRQCIYTRVCNTLIFSIKLNFKCLCNEIWSNQQIDRICRCLCSHRYIV